MRDSRTPSALAAATVKDKRVREFTSEDRKPIVEWLQLGLELMMIQRVHEVDHSPKTIKSATQNKNK